MFIAKFPRIARAAVVAVMMAGVSAAAAQTVTVNANFKPPQLAAGEYGLYVLEISGTASSPNGAVPSVQGLFMQNYGTEQSFSVINNVVTRGLSIRIRVRADSPGRYTIPQYEIEVDGKKYPVPAAALDVIAGAPTAANEPNASQMITLAATVPRTDVYVGEKFPLDLTVSWRADVRANVVGQVVQDGDGFDHVRIYERPEQGVFVRNNTQYVDTTWRFAVTALKAGDQKLGFSLPMQVAVPGTSPINDPMFEQFFGRGLPNVFSRQEEVTVQAPTLELNVQPLPEANRPVNFTGGIGNFSVEAENLSSTDLQVGVPVTLRMTISGKGNFDLLHAPTLDLGSLWRAYTPKESFEASDRTAYRGVKTFEYVIMPMSENITALNMPEFNFFNPETGRYVEVPVPPIPVTVKPAPPGQTLPPLPAVTNTPATTPQTELVGLHFDVGTLLPPTSRPLWASPLFLAAQIIPAIILGALVITRSRRLRLENDPVYARRHRARREAQAALARARAAAAAGNAPEFYAMAQRALQAAASLDHGNAAEALIWPEFNAHLSSRGTPPELLNQAREIFEAGDALRFGGFAPDQAALVSAVGRLDGLVQQLLKRS